MSSLNPTPGQRETGGYKYPAIPDPGASDEELRATVLALKEAVLLLTGQLAGGRGRAIRPSDLGTLLGITGNEVLRAAEGNYAILTYANQRLQELFTADLAAATVVIEAAQAQAQAEFNLLLADEVQGRKAAVATEAQTRQTEDSSLAGQITQVIASNAGNGAAIVQEALARSNGDSALAFTVTALTAVAGRQRVFSQATTPAPPGAGDDAIWIDTGHGNLIKTWDGFQWVANDDTRIASSVAAISAEATARANADGAITLTVNSQQTLIDGLTASITDTDFTRVDKFKALAASITAVNVSIGDVASSVTTEAGARAEADEAISGTVSEVSARTNAGTASGFYRLTAISASMGGVAAEFAVEVSANGTNYARAGMRIQVLGSGASRVLIEGSQFIVGTGGHSPFLIEGDQLYWGGVINGNVILANTIHGDAITANTLHGNRITAGTITTDHFAASSITAEKIAAGTITADRLIADAAVYMRSTPSGVQHPTFPSGVTTTGVIQSRQAVIAAGNPLLVIASIDATFLAPDYASDEITLEVFVDSVLRAKIASVVKDGTNKPPFGFSGVCAVPGLSIGSHNVELVIRYVASGTTIAPSRGMTVTSSSITVAEARNASGS